MLIYLLVILLLIIVYQKYFLIKEGIVFTSSYFIDKYKKDDIVIDTENKTLEKNDEIIHYKKLNKNSKHANFHANKSLISEFLHKHDIPVSKSYTWNNQLSSEENLQHVHSLKKPYVVKPLDGEKGYGVTTDITTTEHLLKCVHELKGKVLIEEQAFGKEYRIMVFNDDIIGITMKTPAFIIGDGEKTVQQLIDSYNDTKLDPYKIHTIDYHYIQQQGYEMNDVLPINEKLIITHVANMSNGSTVNYIDIDTVHPMNILLFKKINHVLELKLSGIDYICDDISLPYYLTGIVIEVNDRPGFGIHYLVCPEDKKKKLVDSVIDNVFE